MTKAKVTLTAVDQMVVDVRNEVLTILVPCDSKKAPLHFLGKVAPVAKAIGITDPTLRSFAEGNSVSASTLSKIQAYLTGRAESAETATE